VQEDLTHGQRLVFVASVLNGVPLEALAAELGPPQRDLQDHVRCEA